MPQQADLSSLIGGLVPKNVTTKPTVRLENLIAFTRASNADGIITDNKEAASLAIKAAGSGNNEVASFMAQLAYQPTDQFNAAAGKLGNADGVAGLSIKDLIDLAAAGGTDTAAEKNIFTIDKDDFDAKTVAVDQKTVTTNELKTVAGESSSGSSLDIQQFLPLLLLLGGGQGGQQGGILPILLLLLLSQQKVA